MPDRWTISLGESAEKLASIHSIDRDAQDAFALRSHRLAAAAWRDGVFTAIVQAPQAPLERDECIREDTSPEKLAKLPAAFVEGGR